MEALKGTNLAGMSTTRERVQDDFYATPDSSIIAILEKEKLEGSIYEPAAGQGHIVRLLKECYPNSEIFATDKEISYDRKRMFSRHLDCVR